MVIFFGICDYILAVHVIPVWKCCICPHALNLNEDEISIYHAMQGLTAELYNNIIFVF